MCPRAFGKEEVKNISTSTALITRYVMILNVSALEQTGPNYLGTPQVLLAYWLEAQD